MKEGAKIWIPIQTVGYVVPDHLKVMQYTTCTAAFGGQMNNVTLGEVGQYMNPLFDLEKCMELKDIEKV